MRLNSIAVLCVGIASAAIPIHAEQNYGALPQREVSGIVTGAAVKLPDFVPVVNYDQFLLASRGDDFGTLNDISFETRSAAEALSARFFQSATDARVPLMQDPETPRMLDAASDPKRMVKLADLSDAQSIIDPAKAVRANVVLQSETVETPRSAVRRTARAAKRTADSNAKPAKRLASRQHRRGVASSAMAQRSANTAYNGIGADLDHLVGFGSLTPDHRMTN